MTNTIDLRAKAATFRQAAHLLRTDPPPGWRTDPDDRLARVFCEHADAADENAARIARAPVPGYHRTVISIGSDYALTVAARIVALTHTAHHTPAKAGAA